MYLVAVAISEVQLRFFWVEEHAWFLGHHLGVNSLIRLHTDHQFIALALLVENVTWHLPELQPYLCLALIQCLATAQDKRYSYKENIK